MALFVLSYARRDGEKLVRKFFDQLVAEVEVMNPGASPAGFMDIASIPTGTLWPQTLGYHLSSAPVLVPVFSPSFFASQECGREVQAFIRRIENFKSQFPGVNVPACIMPVVWIWENLGIHTCVQSFHRDNPGFPPKYLSQKAGLRLLTQVSSDRGQLIELAHALAASITSAVQRPLPPISQVVYEALPSAFHDPSLQHRQTPSGWSHSHTWRLLQCRLPDSAARVFTDTAGEIGGLSTQSVRRKLAI